MTRKGFLLGVALVAALCLAPRAATAEPSAQIWVNGVDIIADDDHAIACGGGTASYDPSTLTLTLDDAQISDTSGIGWGIDASTLGAALTLRLEGQSSCGLIQVDAGLSVEGEGSLEVVDSGAVSSVFSPSGIGATGDIEIDGASVSVTAANGSAISSAVGRVTILGGASVEASGAHAGVIAPKGVAVTGEGTLLKASCGSAASAAVHANETLEIGAGASVEARGMVYSESGDLVVSPGARLSVVDGSLGVYLPKGEFRMDGGEVALEARDYGLYAAGGIRIGGGDLEVVSSDGYAVVSYGQVVMTGGKATFEGPTAALSIPSDEALTFGPDAWYQWAESPTGPTTLSGDAPYSPSDGGTYLRIEPVGTVYDLVVSGGEGSGSYVAGTAVPLRASGSDGMHFVGWRLADPASGGIIADAASPDTTFTMPASAVELVADYEPHSLVHHEGRAPTCTEPGWSAYDECTVCGYSTFSELPATGHDYRDGVCAVCGAREPKEGAVTGAASESALPATGDAASAVGALPVLGACLLASGAALRRH